MVSRLTIRRAGVAALALASVAGFASGGGPRPGRATPDAPSRSTEPLYRFVRNAGQADARWDFVAHGRGLTQLVGPRETEFLLAGGSVRLRFEQAAPSARCAAGRPLPGTSAYLLGDDRSRWLRGLAQFEDVAVGSLYDGVTLRWRDSGRGEPEYCLEIAPGAGAAAIALRVDGGATRIAADGSLVTAGAGGELRQSAPVAYQEVRGSRTPVAVRFVATGGSTFGLDVGAHDAALPLVIDPEIQFSTYLGGDDLDGAAYVAADPAGATYVLGTTISPNFPVKPQTARTFPGHASDVYVAKFAQDGASLVWSVYVGGTKLEYPGGLCVDATGRASVACRTQSDDFPLVNAAFGTAPNAGINDSKVDVGVFRLDAAGAGFDFSTYLGGTDEDLPVGVGLHPSGDLWVGGLTASSDFPLKSPLQAQPGGTTDFFLARFGPAGALVSSTTLGGPLPEVAKAMFVAADGTVALGGYATGTPSANFGPSTVTIGPMTNQSNAAVVAVRPDGSLALAALIGGSSAEAASGVAVDGAGAVYLSGSTQSADFPLAHPLLSRFRGLAAYVGSAFALKLAPDGTLAYSTFLEAPSGALMPECLTIDLQGAVSLAGRVGWFTQAGERDSLAVVKLSPAGDRIVRFDQLPRGPGSAMIRSIALVGGGRAVVAGDILHGELPGPRTVQTGYAGKQDGFVMRIGLPTATAKRMNIRLDFRRAGRDVIRVKGVFEGTSLPPAGSQATIDVGGVAHTFTLDAKGRGRDAGGSARFRVRRTGATFAAKLEGDFAAALADEGLTGDATVRRAARSAALSIGAGGLAYAGDVRLAYTAKAGVRGTAVRRR